MKILFIALYFIFPREGELELQNNVLFIHRNTQREMNWGETKALNSQVGLAMSYEKGF